MPRGKHPFDEDITLNKNKNKGKRSTRIHPAIDGAVQRQLARDDTGRFCV